MKSLIVTAPGELRLLDDVPMPVLGDYDALVRNECCLICNGTDNEIIAGKLSEIQGYPVMLGHESAGYVVDCGLKVRNYRRGDLVTRSIVRQNDKYASGWGGFSEYGVVTDYRAMVEDGYENASSYTIGLMQQVFPPGITPVQAAMTITLKEVYSAFGRLRISARDVLLIVGDGPVGLCMTVLAKAFGVKELYMLGENDLTLPLARRLGATEVFNHLKPGDVQLLKDRCARRISYYVDTVGTDATILQGLPFLAPDGSIVVYGLRTGDTLNLPLEGMRNFGIRFMQFPIHSAEGAAHQAVCDLVLSKAIDLDRLITHCLPIEEFEAGFRLIREKKAVKVALTF
jgi:threonine dehydrogenase-like Zn-dependent dehydrogenase